MRYYWDVYKTHICVVLSVIVTIVCAGFIGYRFFTHIGVLEKPYKDAMYFVTVDYDSSNGLTGTVSDGTYLYDVTGDAVSGPTTLSNKRLPVTESIDPAMYSYTSSVDFNLEEGKLNTYKGSLEDVYAYINVLEDNGYTIKELKSDLKHMDVIMESSDISVRVIVDEHSNIKIFAVDSGKNNTAPPYIIRDENK